jgi:hypothetical protein
MRSDVGGYIERGLLWTLRMVFWAVDGVIAGVRNSRLHWTLCRVQFEHVGLLSSHYQAKECQYCSRDQS